MDSKVYIVNGKRDLTTYFLCRIKYIFVELAFHFFSKLMISTFWGGGDMFGYLQKYMVSQMVNSSSKNLPVEINTEDLSLQQQSIIA